MYLIDTDILIWVLRGDKKYINLLKKLAKQEQLCVSTITIAEIYKNIFPTEIVKTENLLSEMGIFDVTTDISKQAGFYFQQYSKKLKALSLADCLIAATANTTNSTLVSLNRRHFPMEDIKKFKA